MTMSKSNPAGPAIFLPRSFSFRRSGQDGLEVGPEIGVFGPEVEDARLRPDGVAGHGHALEQEPGELGQDDPVLERPGLAFVGVADDEVLGRLFAPAELPLEPRREAGPAPAEEAGSLDLVDDLLGRHGHGLADGRARLVGAEKDRARASGCC